ncbi:unnamed protein product [Fraxinus pennsylvanica]|uniref:Uncharacterized protein n=1 Tax=Fraxinus pennsylvanica TaxID=56036 RepID=A0AAD2DQB2_9LAMI|nr:unnamed protein product [Fraxinus pennsylvanica]
MSKPVVIGLTLNPYISNKFLKIGKELVNLVKKNPSPLYRQSNPDATTVAATSGKFEFTSSNKLCAANSNTHQQRDATTGGFLLFRMTFASHSIPKFRPVAFNLTDFGAVDDGVIINTEALSGQ